EVPRLRQLNPEEVRLLEMLDQFSAADGGARADTFGKMAARKVEITYSNGEREEKLATPAELSKLLELAHAARRGEGRPGGVKVTDLVLKGDPDRLVEDPRTGEWKPEPDLSLPDAMRDLRDRRVARALLEANDKGMPVVPEEQKMIEPRFSFALSYVLAIVVLWFGCNNAAKEIVKEEAIYSRERGVNLGIAAYLASKFWVQSAITSLQALTLLTLVYGVLHLTKAVGNHYWPEMNFHTPPEFYSLSFWPQYGVMVVLAMTGVAMGLLLSACVANPDQANALLPYVLIPQIILGGGILPIKFPSLMFWV